MVIKKENLDRLNQLDRIEYRQKVLFFLGEIIVYSILMMGGLGVYILSLFKEVYSVTIICVLMIFGLMVRLIIKLNALKKELNEEYFKIEVKKK